MKCIARLAAAFALLWAATIGLSGQVRSAGISGLVHDPTGAVVPNAQVTLWGAGSLLQAVASDGHGRYTFVEVQPGDYQVRVSAEGFADYEGSVKATAGAKLSHSINLVVASTRQEITVDDTVRLDLEFSSNAGATVLRGSDLKTLSDDPDDLNADLQALAGPSVGPNGGEIFVDGFSGAKLPPKSAIREVRVNQNPFSAEFDRLGYGRIEILTKPGTDRFRGEAFFNFGDSIFNSRNPFALERPSYQRKMFEGNIGGALTKRASFFIEAERRDIGETAVINALVLDAALNVTPFRATVTTPIVNTELSGRLDYQLNANNTLAGRYEWENTTRTNEGLNTFSLPSQASNGESRDHVLQVTETAVLNASAVHEVRFQYRRSSSSTQPLSYDPAVQVLEAFTTGGVASGLSSFTEKRSELTDMLSLTRNRHTIKLGGRVRGVTQAEVSTQAFNGAFTFTTLEAYRRTQVGLREGLTPEQIRASGGGASQFSVLMGTPSADINQVDAGVFVQDDWRILPQFTLSAGFRYEIQNNIGDRRSLAPRIGFAWAPGSQSRPLTVIRAGFGMFYDRVSQGLALEAARLDGVQQREFVVPNPDFYPNVPPLSSLAGNVREQAIRVVDGGIRAPYIMQSAISVERQLPKNTTVSLTFSSARGLHMLRSRNINAPLPGTYDPVSPERGIRAYPGGNIYLYESSGTFRQNQLLLNVNARLNRRLSFFGFYAWNKARSDTDGAGSFPANQYNTRGDYGRAGFDQRHRVFMGGSIAAPLGFSLNPFVVISSGGPFNITLGRDLNGDSLFNDRPTWASELSRASVVRTPWGVFDADPIAGQTIIPRNLGQAPGQVTINLRLSKAFGFGERYAGVAAASGGPQHGAPVGIGPGGGHGGHGPGHGPHGESGGGNSRYTLTVSASARNLLNTVNLGAPVGNLSSPLFGTSVALAGFGHHSSASANRTIELQARFSF